MNYETIKYEVANNILTLTLNRPDKLNAFTGQMMDELISAFDNAGKDDEVRIIIVTGAGRGFCAGADLSSGSNTFNRDVRNNKGSDKYLQEGSLCLAANKSVIVPSKISSLELIESFITLRNIIGCTELLPRSFAIKSATAEENE